MVEGWHDNNPEFPGDNPNGYCSYEAMLASDSCQERRRERWRAYRTGAWSDAAIAAWTVPALIWMLPDQALVFGASPRVW